MKKFNINKTELDYLEELVIYLSEPVNSLSPEGSELLKEVIDRVKSRPVLDTMIDPSVLTKEDGKVITND